MIEHRQLNAVSVSLLLSAISSAVTYEDRERAMELINAGWTWTKARTDVEADAAWDEIEVIAEWRAR